MKIGVLDIQGSVVEHVHALEECGVEAVRVKKAEDLEGVTGLVIPGGESTTLGKLLRKFGLRKAIVDRVRGGLPVWGTCAGAILLAKEIVGDEKVDGLGLMDVSIERNAYGGQLDSFEGEVEFEGKGFHAIFIRAPRLGRVGKEVEILAKYEGDVVMAREKNIFITLFHPELTKDLRVHRYFVKMC